MGQCSCQMTRKSIFMLISIVLVAPSMRIAIDLTSLHLSNENMNKISVSLAHALSKGDIPVNLLYIISDLLLIIVYSYEFAQVIRMIAFYKTRHKKRVLSFTILSYILIITWFICDLIQINVLITNNRQLHRISKSISFLSAGIYQILHSMFIFKFIQKQLNDPCGTCCEFKVFYLVTVMLITNLMIISYIGSEWITDKRKEENWVEWIAVMGINVYVFGFIPLFITEFKHNQFTMVEMEEDYDDETDKDDPVDTETEISILP